MGILQFNGSTDYLKWASLDAALSNLPTAAWTLLFGVRHANMSNWQGYGYLLSGTGAGVSEVGLSKSKSATEDLTCDRDPAHGSTFSWASLDPAVNQDTLFVASKAAGSATANASKKVGVSGSWSHGAATSPGGNASAADQLQLGIWQLSSIDALNGYLAVAAMWNVELTQAQRIACGATWKTSDIWNAHPTVRPLLLMECNVPKTALTNLGSSVIDTPSSSGVTLASGQTFGGWNFDGYGSSFLPLL